MARPKTISDEELLEVARRVFQQRGHAATAKDIAEEAGISSGILFQRFGSKDELFFAAMMPPPPNVATLLGDDAEQDAEKQLVRIALRLLEYFAGVAPSILNLVTHPSSKPESIGKAHDHLLAGNLVKAVRTRFETLSRRGAIAPVNTQAAADAFVSALHNMAIFEMFLGGGTQAVIERKRVEHVVRVFWQGLAPR